MTDYVLTGLVKRRSELSGEIDATYKALQKMIADLEILDATILQFDPDYKVDAIKAKAFRPPKDWARRGEMTKAVLKILRLAGAPLTSQDVALQLMAEQALDPNERRLAKLMVKRVGACLREQRDRGIVQSDQGAGMWNLWQIVR